MRHYLLFLIAITLFYNCQEQEEKILTPSPNEVLKITEKVANWQIETFEEMGKYRALPSPEKRKKWHNRDKHHELEWTNFNRFGRLSNYVFIKFKQNR